MHRQLLVFAAEQKVLFSGRGIFISRQAEEARWLHLHLVHASTGEKVTTRSFGPGRFAG